MFWGAIKRAHEFAGVAAFFVAMLAGIGFTYSPPWATHADVEGVKTTIDQVQRQQSAQILSTEKQNCTILQLLRDRYLKEQLDAQMELNKNPSSPTLQRARDEAKANVEYLEGEQRVAKCHRIQAPISSSTPRPPMEAPPTSGLSTIRTLPNRSRMTRWQLVRSFPITSAIPIRTATTSNIARTN